MFRPHRTSIFSCAGKVIVWGDQQLSPPGYLATFVKAAWRRNERQERSERGKRVVGKCRKKIQNNIISSQGPKSCHLGYTPHLNMSRWNLVTSHTVRWDQTPRPIQCWASSWKLHHELEVTSLVLLTCLLGATSKWTHLHLKITWSVTSTSQQNWQRLSFVLARLDTPVIKSSTPMTKKVKRLILEEVLFALDGPQKKTYSFKFHDIDITA